MRHKLDLFPLSSLTEQDLEDGGRTPHQRLLPRQDERHSGRAGGGARHCPGLPVPVTTPPCWSRAATALGSPEGSLLAALKKKPSLLPTVQAAVCVSPPCVCQCQCVCVCVTRPLLQVFKNDLFNDHNLASVCKTLRECLYW